MQIAYSSPAGTDSNLHALILRRIAEVGQVSVAESLGVATSTVSRWMSGQQGIPIEMLGPLFDVLGIYVSEDATITQEIKLPQREYDALCVLARKALE